MCRVGTIRLEYQPLARRAGRENERRFTLRLLHRHVYRGVCVCVYMCTHMLEQDYVFLCVCVSVQKGEMSSWLFFGKYFLYLFNFYFYKYFSKDCL